MNKDNEFKSWERFCISGEVGDYLAYRQFVNRRMGGEQANTGEVTNSAADHRGNSDTGPSVWRG